MLSHLFFRHKLEYTIMFIWACNCILLSVIAIREVWIPNMNAGTDAYTKIQSDEFDGTSMPISYIPDWTKPANQDKSKRFEDIAISEYIPLPLYDARSLEDTTSQSKNSMIIHFTYTVPYMGSYRFNYKENDGSHLWVDIRAPIWTPVLSIANGVVIRTVEADNVGNKFVVIRHDNVPLNGKRTTLYSGYLHLSQITVTEWTKIRKWEMLGRVGMTGIATTPHLHFQIDTADAPFHPYWPFTSADTRSAWLWFFESVSAWLWRDNAERYTIHPMNFINTYLGGYTQSSSSVPQWVFNSAPIEVLSANSSDEEQRAREIMLWSFVSEPIFSCEKKRFEDVPTGSSLWKILYPLVDNDCMFQKDGKFNAKENITNREAISMIFDYFGIVPSSGTSHFLDISIGDSFQGYAIVAYRMWVLDGNYANPDKIISKEEFIQLLSKTGKLKKNPSGIKIYADVDSMNPNYPSIQDYGFSVGIRGGKFNPKMILTRSLAVQILSKIKK